ncbi:MAG: glycosyl transferase [Chlorobi bacterium]|nr:glycosyl transferase [Chlorobiota bacterium]
MAPRRGLGKESCLILFKPRRGAIPAARGIAPRSTTDDATMSRSAIARALGSRLFLPSLLGLALLLRLGWVAWAYGDGVRPVSDAGWYFQRGIEMAHGAGYAVDGAPTAYWPVGYPAFLGLLVALFGTSPLPAMLANVALQIGMIAATLGIARRVTGSETAARLAVLILAVAPNMIAYSSLLLSESLFVMLMLAALLLFLKGIDRAGYAAVAVAGLLFGLAALVKPQAIPIPAVVLAALLIGRRRDDPLRTYRRSTALIYVIMLATLLPWMARNYGLFGRFGIISTNDGINLFIGNNPSANGTYLLNDTLEREYFAAPDEPARNGRARDIALRHIAAHPLATLALIPRKLWYLYRADAEGFSWNQRSLPDPASSAGRRLDVLKIISFGYWIPLLGACLGGMADMWRQRTERWGGALGGAIILYFTLVPLVFFGDGRFHFPVIPWMAIYAAMVIASRVRGALPRAPGIAPLRGLGRFFRQRGG